MIQTKNAGLREPAALKTIGLQRSLILIPFHNWHYFLLEKRGLFDFQVNLRLNSCFL